MRAEFEWQNTRLLLGECASSSLAARTRICPVSSDGRAPVLQTGSRRLEPSTGYQIWGRRLIGRTPVLQTGNEGSFPSASTKFGRPWFSGRIRHCQCRGAGSIPADRSTRRWYMGCASAFQAEEADSISARRSRFSGCRVTGSPPALGAGRWRFKSSHPDQFFGKWPSAQGAGFGYRRSRVEIPPSRPDCCGVEEWFLGGLISHTGRFDSGPRYHFFCPRRLAAGFLILDQGTRIQLPPRVRGRGGVGVLAALSMPRTPVQVRSSPPIFMACSSIGRMGDFQSVEAGSTPAQATKGALCKSSTTFRCGEPRLTKAP